VEVRRPGMRVLGVLPLPTPPPIVPCDGACRESCARWLGLRALCYEVLPLPFLRYRRVKIQGRGRVGDRSTVPLLLKLYEVAKIESKSC
jgi:hypothetical protein